MRQIGRSLATVELIRIKNTAQIRMATPYFQELSKYEELKRLDYPDIGQEGKGFQLGWDFTLYAYVSAGVIYGSCYVSECCRYSIFNFHNGRPLLKETEGREFTGVFVHPLLRGNGLVGKFISAALEDYDALLVLPKTKKEAVLNGLRLLSEITGMTIQQIEEIAFYGTESFYKYLKNCDFKAVVEQLKEYVGAVDATSIPMEIAAKNRGIFIGYSFPWLGPVYLLTRGQ